MQRKSVQVTATKFQPIIRRKSKIKKNVKKYNIIRRFSTKSQASKPSITTKETTDISNSNELKDSNDTVNDNMSVTAMKGNGIMIKHAINFLNQHLLSINIDPTLWKQLDYAKYSASDYIQSFWNGSSRIKFNKHVTNSELQLIHQYLQSSTIQQEFLKYVQQSSSSSLVTSSSPIPNDQIIINNVNNPECVKIVTQAKFPPMPTSKSHGILDLKVTGDYITKEAASCPYTGPWDADLFLEDDHYLVPQYLELPLHISTSNGFYKTGISSRNRPLSLQVALSDALGTAISHQTSLKDFVFAWTIKEGGEPHIIHNFKTGSIDYTQLSHLL